MLDSISEWIGLIGITISVITSITIPIKKIIKKKKEDKQKEEKDKKMQQDKLKNIDERLTSLEASSQNTSKQTEDILRKLENFFDDYDEFSTQNLKYMINDAYFCYESIEDIPEDILLNACECCDIYVHKRNKNHEIRPRCEILWKELEDRAIQREGHHV